MITTKSQLKSLVSQIPWITSSLFWALLNRMDFRLKDEFNSNWVFNSIELNVSI